MRVPLRRGRRRGVLGVVSCLESGIGMMETGVVV
jgi:hypothetical protein